MSGQTYLCEICRLVIQWSGSMNRWYVERVEIEGDPVWQSWRIWQDIASKHPYPHQHRPRNETPDGRKIK